MSSDLWMREHDPYDYRHNLEVNRYLEKQKNDTMRRLLAITNEYPSRERDYYRQESVNYIPRRYHTGERFRDGSYTRVSDKPMDVDEQNRRRAMMRYQSMNDVPRRTFNPYESRPYYNNLEIEFIRR
jgi:hypothetical protein